MPDASAAHVMGVLVLWALPGVIAATLLTGWCLVPVVMYRHHRKARERAAAGRSGAQDREAA